MHTITSKLARIDENEIRVHGEELELTIREASEGGDEEYAGRAVLFDPPVVVTCFKEDGKDEYSISWDFGFSYKESSAGQGAYGTPADAPWVKKALASVEYDLYHSYFHTALDPNYGAGHYAIFGCLALNGRAKWKNEDGSIQEICGLP